MSDRLPVHAIDPAGATDGQSPKYDAATGRVIWATGGSGSTDPEVVRDTMAAALVAGAGITITPDDAANTITIAATGGGGGGSLTVQDENGAVATGVTQIDFQGAGVTATAGTGEVVVTIPGSSGGGGGATGIDAPPASPNAKDDEFDGTSTVTWTNTPTTANASDIGTTRPSHLYVKGSGSGATQVGKLQTAPTTYPFTIFAKTSATTAKGDYHKAGGIILTVAAPTTTSPVCYIGPQHNGDYNFGRASYNNFGTSFVSGTNKPKLAQRSLFYTKVVVNSATSITWYYSPDGYLWQLGESAFTLPFSIGKMGLGLTEEGATAGPVEALFDFFRIS